MSMDIISSGTHGTRQVPTGAVLNIYPDSVGSSARATCSNSTYGPWTVNGAPMSLGPFASLVAITVECLAGHAGVDVAAPGGGGSLTPSSADTLSNKTISDANNVIKVGGTPIAQALAASIVPVADNLTTPFATSALSANQGVVLESQIASLVTQFQQITTGGAITIVNDTPSVAEDTTLTGNVLANDTTSSGTLSVTQFVISGLSGINAAGATVAIPSVGSITIGTTGAYTFVPVANYNGAVPTITYQVTNGSQLKNGNLSISVTAVNDPPSAQADSTGTLQGQPVTINVLANDADIDANVLTITQINGTAVAPGGTLGITNGSVTLNVDKTLTYTPNANVTGAQTFSYTISDGQGGTAVANVTVNVVATGGSVATPVILYYDCPTGPTGFPTATGEGGLGGYISIFGRNLFNQASDLGSLTKVYIGGIEVANYRYGGPAVTFTKTGIQRITFQTGTLGNAAVGTALPITVVRNGTATSNNDKTFTPSGGRVLFVALAAQNGNNSSAAAGDVTKPWRNLQLVDNTNNASTMTGVASILVAGDQVVIRGGNWSDAVGFDNTWFRFRNFANQGLVKKWVHFTSYPGTAGANSPEVVSYVTPTGTPPNTVGSSAYRGGIHGANSAYAGQTGDYVAVSNLHLASSADSSSDACGVNLQYSSGPWWEVNNEIGPWPSAINSKAAGFSGHGVGSRCWGNYIHDLQCVGAQETHGFYIDSPDKTMPDQSMDIDVGWNWFATAPGGNGGQFNDNLGSSDGSGTWRGFKGITVHHNWFGKYAKYGMNFGPGTVQAKFWSNVLEDGAFGWCRLDSTASGIDLQVDFNTAYNCDQTVSGPGNGQMISTASSGGSGTVKLRGNIIVAGPQTIAGSQIFANTGGTPATWQPDGNLYFGPSQTTVWSAANFSTDATHGIFADPLFTAAASHDFTLQAGSPAIDAAQPTAPTYVLDDYLGVGRPQGAGPDLGAYERISTLPFVTAAPAFSGTARVGATSSVGTGTWGNGPITAYAYQWFTATTLNGTPTPILGATTSSYVWQIGDYGKFGGCQVTATNAAGPTTKTVFTGAAVLANVNAPANTTAPSITGTGGIGNLLTRVAGVWTPSSGADAASIAWVWQRGGVAIAGTANAATYTQVSADDNTVINLVETGTNQWGSNSVASSNSITVPHVSSAPTLVGSAVAFSSTPTTVTVARTVQAGDIIVLCFACGGGSPGSLTVTDSTGGITTDWVDAGDTSSGNTNSGIRYRLIAAAGTVTATIGKDSGINYAGTALVIRGCDAAAAIDGASVSALFTASPTSSTPTNSTFAKDLQVAVFGGTDSRYATGFTYSDTFLASSNDATQAKQCQVQTRTTTTTGVHSAFTFTFTAGTSGTDARCGVSVFNFKGF